MSILSTIAGSLEGTPAANNPGAAAPGGAVLTQIINMIQSHPGGLGGLLQSFQQSGLGHIFQSWLSTGPNLPVSPEQLRNTLGAGWISRIAQATGLPPEQIEQQLSTLLPQIVDHLSPNGQLPHGDLGGLLGGVAQRFAR